MPSAEYGLASERIGLMQLERWQAVIRPTNRACARRDRPVEQA
jgi:hypothetical protein